MFEQKIAERPMPIGEKSEAFIIFCEFVGGHIFCYFRSTKRVVSPSVIATAPCQYCGNYLDENQHLPQCVKSCHMFKLNQQQGAT